MLVDSCGFLLTRCLTKHFLFEDCGQSEASIKGQKLSLTGSVLNRQKHYFFEGRVLQILMDHHKISLLECVKVCGAIT